jgi:hypothetical protein
VYVFDAAGATECSGSPVTCQPLFRTGGGDDPAAYPTVAGGLLYVPGLLSSSVSVYDATGQQGCGAGVCSALFTLDTSGATGSSTSTVSVGSGVAYAVGGQRLLAFDATGSTGCGGTPKVCAPLWTAPLTGPSTAPPTLAAGRVFVPELTGDPNRVEAFDAAGSSSCSGAPKVCSPLATFTVSAGTEPRLAASKALLFATSSGLSGPPATFDVFDLSATQGCSGTPVVCAPLRHITTSVSPLSGPAVAAGRVAIRRGNPGPVALYAAPG